MRWRSASEIKPGDHFILIYENADELLAFAVPFIKDGLAKGERCIYVVDDLTPTQVTNALAEGGVDVDRESKRGALMLLNRHEHSIPPPFGVTKMVERILQRASDASASGFAGVRFAAELTWARGMEVRDDLLAEYDSLFDIICAPRILTFVCMYRRDQFSPSMLRDLVRSHAKVVAGDDVYLNLCALFQDLAQADLDRLLESAGQRRMPRGEFFFHQGDRADHVYALASGKVKLVRTDSEGRNVTLHIALPTEPFGHVDALTGVPRLVSAQTLEDSRAFVWDTSTVLQTITHHPSLSLKMMRSLAEKVQEGWDHVADLATDRSDLRIARLLLRLVQSVGHKLQPREAIELKLSHQDLAEMANTTQFTVSRVLSSWRRQNIVEVGRERIVVLDLQRLTAIAGEAS
jgi:CRP/FNR family transcriptional regulator, nitrogen oxide reductase regulator